MTAYHTQSGPLVLHGDVFAVWDALLARRPGATLVVTTNATRVGRSGRALDRDACGVMGKGVAAVAAQRWPDLRSWWSRVVTDGYADDGGFWASPFDPDRPAATLIGRRVGCLVTKRRWWDDADAAFVAHGLSTLAVWLGEHPECDLCLLPLPGAGLGRLPPAVAVDLCRRHLDGRCVVVHRCPTL